MESQYLEKVKAIVGNVTLQELEYEKCRRDPYYFITNWLFTLDSHDQENPIKQFPDEDYLYILTVLWAGPKIYPDYKERLHKYYAEEIIDEIFDNWAPLLLVPKSRQMKASWLFTALYLWQVQFYPGTSIFFQSKKEVDADSLIKRSKLMYDNEPFFLKKYQVNPSNRGEHVFCKLEFPEIHSSIIGIPEGGDQIRMHTATGVFADEMAFQPSALDSYTAAKPTIDGGGRYTGVSTANPGFFHELVEDRNV